MNQISKMQSILINRIKGNIKCSETEIISIINDKNDNFSLRISLYIKSLETFTWQELVLLWGLDEVDKLYTENTRRMIFSKYLREQYDGVFELLRNNTLTYTERTPEEYEEFKNYLLFARRNRCKHGRFSSLLFR